MKPDHKNRRWLSQRLVSLRDVSTPSYVAVAPLWAFLHVQHASLICDCWLSHFSYSRTWTHSDFVKRYWASSGIIATLKNHNYLTHNIGFVASLPGTTKIPLLHALDCHAWKSNIWIPPANASTLCKLQPQKNHQRKSFPNFTNLIFERLFFGGFPPLSFIGPMFWRGACQSPVTLSDSWPPNCDLGDSDFELSSKAWLPGKVFSNQPTDPTTEETHLRICCKRCERNMVIHSSRIRKEFPSINPSKIPKKTQHTYSGMFFWVEMRDFYMKKRYKWVLWVGYKLNSLNQSHGNNTHRCPKHAIVWYIYGTPLKI